MSEIIKVSKEAETVLTKVSDLVNELTKAEGGLERGYTQLARVLLIVREKRYWEGKYESWGKYIEDVKEQMNVGRAQLYQKMRVVEELDGIVDEAALNDIGITKASVLADAYRKYEKLPTELIEAAKDEKVTKADLKKFVAETFHAPQDERNEWYDMRMAFYVNPEEKSEIQQAEQLARIIDPPISNSLQDFMQKKEIMLRLVREFIATYANRITEKAPF